MTVKSRVPQLNWDASLHDQGLAGLLEKGAGLAACSRFFNVGGDMGKTLKVKQVFPVKSAAEERCKQGSVWGGLGNPGKRVNQIHTGFHPPDMPLTHPSPTP